MEYNFRLTESMRLLAGRALKGINRFFVIGTLTMVIGVIALSAMAAEDQSGGEEVVDRIVAVVNNDIILLSDVRKALAPYVKKIKERRLLEKTEEAMLSRAHEDILDSLINEKLTLEKAAELRITASEEEVNAALEQMKKSALYSEETFRSFLSEAGYTMDEYREQVKNQIIKSKFLNQEIKSKTVVTTEEIEDYFRKHQDEFASGTQYHLKHIIMPVPQDAIPDEKETVRQKMEDIHKQIKDGASFEAMAKQYSQSSFAKVGGDLGIFAEADLAPELKDAIISTKEGDITPVIKTHLGYQIFYIQSVIKSDGSLTEDVSRKIHEKLYNEKLDEKFNEWVTQLRDSAHVEIMK